MSVIIIPPIVKDEQTGEYRNYQIPPAEYHTVCEIINRCSHFCDPSDNLQCVVNMGAPDDKGKVEHTIRLYRGEISMETQKLFVCALRRSWDAKLEFHS